MAHCINQSHPKYKKILIESNIKKPILNAKIAAWQQLNNNYDTIPNLEDINIKLTNKVELFSIGTSTENPITNETLESLETVPFKFNIDQILKHNKTITVRPNFIKKGTYREVISNRAINIYPQGNLYLNQYLGMTGMDIEEFKRKFFGESFEDSKLKEDHIVSFFNNEIPLEIYTLTPITLEEEVIINVVDARFKSLIERREKQLKLLKSQLRNATNTDLKAELKSKIEYVENQLNILNNKDVMTFELLLNQMAADIQLVKSEIATNSKDSIQFALGLITNYQKVLFEDCGVIFDSLDETTKNTAFNLMYEINNLIEEANNKLINLANNIVKNNIEKSILDSEGNLEEFADIGQGKRFTQPTQQVNNPIIQAATKLIKKALSIIDLKFQKFTNTHNKLVKNLKSFQKNLGIKGIKIYNYLLDEDEKGNFTRRFVQQYINSYFKEKFDPLKSYKEKLKFLASEHTHTFNKELWEIRKKELRKYWEDNHFLDTEAKIKTYNPSISEEDLKLQIEIAYDDWFRLRNAERMFNTLNRIKSDSIITESDVNFYKTFINSNGFFKVKTSEGYKDVINSVPEDKYLNPKWVFIDSLQDTDPRKQFYNHVVENMIDTTQRLGDVNYFDWGYIPEKLDESSSVLGQVHDYLINNISEHIHEREDVRDPNTGEIYLTIPKYTRNKGLSNEEMDWDISRVLKNYVQEGLRFEEKSKIQEDLQLLEMLLKKVKKYKTNLDGTPKMVDGEIEYIEDISNLEKMLQYRIEAQIYNKSKKVQLPSKTQVSNRHTKQKVKKLNEEMQALNLTVEEKEEARLFINTNSPYTGTNEKVGRFIELGISRKKLLGLRKYITGSSFADGLISYTALKFLGLNIFAGLGDLLEGLTTLTIERGDKTYLPENTLLRALKIIMASLTPWNNQMKSKISGVSKIFKSVYTPIESYSLENKIPEMAMIQYKTSGYIINNTWLVGFLKSKKIKDNLDVEHSLWDIVSINEETGELVVPDNFKSFYDELGEPTSELINLIQEFQELLARVRDRQDSVDPIELKKDAVGRLIAQFKGNWMINGFLRRFGSAQPDMYLEGGERKGYYRSWWELFKLNKKEDVEGNLVNDYSILSFMSALGRGLRESFRATALGKLMGENTEISEIDQKNLKKFMREMSLILTVNLVLLLLQSKLVDEDDDDKKGIIRYLVNQNIRLIRDMTTYLSPNSFISVVKNPLVAVSAVQDIWKLAESTVRSTVLFDPYTAKNELRIWKDIKKTIPGVRQLDYIENMFNKQIRYGH